jgi:two-component system response regulator CpxR
MGRILLADDDVELCKLLKAFLVGEGFEVEMVHDGASALDQATSGDCDLMVLDVMMPHRNGFDVLRLLRARKLTPVLMLTARGEDVDSIVGLELGADDYLAKPCNPRVLLARIRAILRRSEPAAASINGVPEVLKAGDVTLQPAERSVLRGSERIAMTSTEFSVLEALLRDAGRVVPKADLSERALGRPLGRFDRSLDMHVSNLRRKLGDYPSGEERIKTVRGTGYQYVVI